jgi:hypothetical protein
MPGGGVAAVALLAVAAMVSQAAAQDDEQFTGSSRCQSDRNRHVSAPNVIAAVAPVILVLSLGFAVGSVIGSISTRPEESVGSGWHIWAGSGAPGRPAAVSSAKRCDVTR